MGDGCIHSVRRSQGPGRSELCTISRSGRSLKLGGGVVQHFGLTRGGTERNLPVIYNVENIIILNANDVLEAFEIFLRLAIKLFDGFPDDG